MRRLMMKLFAKHHSLPTADTATRRSTSWRRREVLFGVLAMALGAIGCKREPHRYEVFYYYIPG